MKYSYANFSQSLCGQSTNQQIWGLLGGHDGQRPVGEFGQDAEVTPLLFSKKNILGF